MFQKESLQIKGQRIKENIGQENKCHTSKNKNKI